MPNKEMVRLLIYEAAFRLKIPPLDLHKIAHEIVDFCLWKKCTFEFEKRDLTNWGKD